MINSTVLFWFFIQFLLLYTYQRSKIPPNFDDLLTSLLSSLLGKPEEYCLVEILPAQIMNFGGCHEPTAVLTLTSVGSLGTVQNKKYSEAIMSLLEESLNVAPTLTYIFFVDSKPSDIMHDIQWGSWISHAQSLTCHIEWRKILQEDAFV